MGSYDALLKCKRCLVHLLRIFSRNDPAQYQLALAEELAGLATTHALYGDVSDGLRAAEEAEELLNQVELSTSISSPLLLWLKVMDTRSVLHWALDEYEDAVLCNEKSTEKYREIIEKSRKDGTMDLQIEERYAIALGRFADQLRQMQDRAREALSLYRRALAVWVFLLKTSPQTRRYAENLQMVTLGYSAIEPDKEEANAVLKEALDAIPDSFQDVRVALLLVVSDISAEKPLAGEPEARCALHILDEWTGETGSLPLKLRLAAATALSNSLRRLDRDEEAVESMKITKEKVETILTANPTLADKPLLQDLVEFMILSSRYVIIQNRGIGVNFVERSSLLEELGNGQEAIRSGKLALEYGNKLKALNEATGNLHLGLATLNLSLLLAQQGRSQQSYRRAQAAYDIFRHVAALELQDRVAYLRIIALDHLLTISIKLGISSHRLSSPALDLANYIVEAEDSVWEVKDATPETLPYYRARLLWELYRLLEPPDDHGRSIDRARLTPMITTAVERLQDVEGQEGIFVDALVDLDMHLRDVGRVDRSLSGRIIAATEKWMEVESEKDKDVTLNFLRLPMALVHSASDDINESAFESAARSLHRAMPLLRELGEVYLEARKPGETEKVQDREPIPPVDVTQKQVVGYWLYALELQRAVLLHDSATPDTSEERQKKKREQAKRALKICREIKTILSAYPESLFVRARLHNTEAFVEAYRVLGRDDDAKKELAKYEEDWGASVMNPAYADEEVDVVPVLLSGILRLTRLKCLLYENAKDAEGKAKWEEAVKEMETLMDVERKEDGGDKNVKVTAEDRDEVRQQLRQGVLFEAYHPSIWKC